MQWQQEKCCSRVSSSSLHPFFLRLLNWCQNRVERHVAKMIENDAFAEAAVGMKTLLLLITPMPWLDDSRKGTVFDKRNTWAGQPGEHTHATHGHRGRASIRWTQQKEMES